MKGRKKNGNIEQCGIVFYPGILPMATGVFKLIARVMPQVAAGWYHWHPREEFIYSPSCYLLKKQVVFRCPLKFDGISKHQRVGRMLNDRQRCCHRNRRTRPFNNVCIVVFDCQPQSSVLIYNNNVLFFLFYVQISFCFQFNFSYFTLDRYLRTSIVECELGPLEFSIGIRFWKVKYEYTYILL